MKNYFSTFPKGAASLNADNHSWPAIKRPSSMVAENSLSRTNNFDKAGTLNQSSSISQGNIQESNATVTDFDQPTSMTTPLISRSSLDRKIIRVQREVLKMGALVENSCFLAKEALCDRNLDAAKRLPIQDKEIDALYRQIEVDCTNLLNLEAPVTQDLRLVSALMQIVRDLERIGDYCKSIGNSAIRLFPYPAHESMYQIGVMLDRCRSMVALCLRSLCELDSEAGVELKRKDDIVDDDYERLYQQLVNTPFVAGSVEPIVLLVLVIRALERIADHATNVGRRVSFVVTGERH